MKSTIAIALTRVRLSLFRLMVPVLAMCCAAANAAEYGADWGPAIGGQVTLEAYDQDGELRTLENLAGERGLLLFMNRSADW